MKPTNQKLLLKFINDVFVVSLFTFVILFFLETIKPKIVIAYFNLNYLLLFCLIAGGLMLFIDKEPESENKIENKTVAEKRQLGLFSLICFLILLTFLWSLEFWGWLISLIGGITVWLIGIAI